MTKKKNVAGAMDAERVIMTVQLAANVTELALSHKNKKWTSVMTLMNNKFWPFPPATGAVPWTAKQIKEYAQQQRAQTEDALL
jgi:pyruvate/2-oxoacid:ferredoxin oxidoreductase alpha subunit